MVVTKKGVLSSCKPRKEVLEGELNDAIFAAEFRYLINGTAQPVYRDPKLFFQNTEPTENLKSICHFIFRSLNDKKEGGQLIRLSTGYGGGKSHTLMALWHLAHNVSDSKFKSELLPSTGYPKKIKVVAIDAAEAGIPIFTTHDKTKIHSIQGELFWQLGGATAIKNLGEADHHESCPEERLLSQMLGTGPLLILLDELVVYMASLSTTGQGNFLNFIGKLISAVKMRPETVLVLTDPGSQQAYADISRTLGGKIEPAALKMDDIFGRKMSDYDPIGKSAAKVIARRLFEKIDQGSAKIAAEQYHNLYARILEQNSKLLPDNVASEEVKKSIEECYPFHPRLIETAKERLGPLPEFQRSRGVLRLFARIVRDTWDQKVDLDLITSGDINWGSDRIRSDLLQRLRREQFAAAVDADIEGHAKKLDGGKKGIHYRVASALLLESLPRNENSGLNGVELSYAILKLDEAGSEPVEALDRLTGQCWHTYPMDSKSEGWQFRFEPNIIKQIEQKTSLIDVHEAEDRIFSEAQGYFAGPIFKLSPWPERPKDVVETKDLKLILCSSIPLAEQVCAYADTSDSKAPIPRLYRNAIVAVAPTVDSLNNAIDRAKRLIASEQIERDAKHGESHALVREQLKGLKPKLIREFKLQTYRAFNTIVRSDGVVGSLEEKYQVADEDELLSKPQGQKSLIAFLEDKDLIFPAGKALDPDKFVKDVLAGTTPVPDQPDVYLLSDVHARFLSAPKLRLARDTSVIKATIVKALETGRVYIRLEDGSAYSGYGRVDGLPGKRTFTDGIKPTIHLRENECITRADSQIGQKWIKVDPKPRSKGVGEEPFDHPPPLPEQEIITVQSWDDLIRHSETRPLRKLDLISSKPADSDMLISYAQPLGADQITLDVSVSGELKGGGNASFEVNGVKLTSSIKPLDSARGLFTAMQEGMSYEASLHLLFNEPGRGGKKTELENIADKVSEDITILAILGKAGEKK